MCRLDTGDGLALDRREGVGVGRARRVAVASVVVSRLDEARCDLGSEQPKEGERRRRATVASGAPEDVARRSESRSRRCSGSTRRPWPSRRCDPRAWRQVGSGRDDGGAGRLPRSQWNARTLTARPMSGRAPPELVPDGAHLDNSARRSVYGTEGRRFESSRARSLLGPICRGFASHARGQRVPKRPWGNARATRPLRGRLGCALVGGCARARRGAVDRSGGAGTRLPPPMKAGSLRTCQLLAPPGPDRRARTLRPLMPARRGARIRRGWLGRRPYG
jgi:hypothetical protein